MWLAVFNGVCFWFHRISKISLARQRRNCWRRGHETWQVSLRCAVEIKNAGSKIVVIRVLSAYSGLFDLFP